MKNLFIAIAFLFATFVNAQNSLFTTISENDKYQEYLSVTDKDNDGFYQINDKRFILKFELKHLSTGEGYSISAIIQEGEKKGKKSEAYNVASGYYEYNGYPYESVIRHKYQKDGIVAIGDYIFTLNGISKDGTSFSSIDDVYIKIKEGVLKEETTKITPKKNKKKKKMSFFQKMKALKKGGLGKSSSRNFGPEHKDLEGKNLNKMITDYLVAMKVKQDGRTDKQKMSDKNLINAKKKVIEDIKRYNDSVRATPEHQDLQRRIKRNEANYQAAKAQNSVTLRNKGSKKIYVGTSGSANKGTEIRAGGTASWNCDQDAYIMIETIKGSTYSYRSSKTKVYTANSGCGNTVNVR